MKKKLFNVFLFTAGAAVGSLVTWKIVKTRYERIAQEEIDSVKKTWARMMREETEKNGSTETEEQDEEDPEDEDSEGYEYDQVTMTAYHDIANMYSKSGVRAENYEEGEGDQDEDVPYINGPILILPEEFADGNYDHDCYSLTYYADGVLADDWYKKYDVDDTIGEESVEHFGDYVADVIHVRNERLKADYEVIKDPRNYADMIHNDPLMSAYET